MFLLKPASLAALISSGFSVASAQSASSSASQPEAIWNAIPATTDLRWAPCYTNLLCARLQVPLDYSKPNGSTAAIALARVPSAYKSTDPRYKGPILFNPGGPGGSGVDAMNDFGPLLQQITGDAFDIVSFDPRGVARTTPQLLTFNTSAEENAFVLKTFEDPPLNATVDALARTYARFQVVGSLAQRRVADVAPYVSTLLVARDMLAITQAFGREKLQYWGISYGTVLGATFASMFPDKVERMVVDGVIDPVDYYAAGYQTNLITFDKGLDIFYEACAAAGSNQCALHEATADAVKQRVNNLFASLKTRPIAVPVTANGTDGPLDYGVVDYGVLRRVMKAFAYSPFTGALNGSSLATALAALERGDGAPLWAARDDPQQTNTCSAPDAGAEQQQAQFAFGSEATLAIGCSDGAPVLDSLDELQAWYESNAKLSSFADVWPYRVICAGWKIRPVESFNGTFGGNTSFPILFVSNIGDPVAPAVDSVNLQKNFTGSSIVLQNSAGHTSIAATSLCTAGAIQTYFQAGAIPKNGTLCEISNTYFGNGTAQVPAPAGRRGLVRAVEDARLFEAARALSERFQPQAFRI